MRIPLQFHLNEIKWRFGYFFFSFSNCLIIILNYHEAVFFWTTYSFSFVNDGKFITTHIAELFTTCIYISVNIVAFLNFPYAWYHCFNFFSSSWYKAQAWLFTQMQIFTFVTFFITKIIAYFLILPHAYVFLDTWTITTIYAFKVQLEARIEIYIRWACQTTYFLSNIIYLFSVRIIHFYLMDNMTNLHLFLRRNKKWILFFTFLFSSICLPAESVIQFYAFFFSLVFSEIIFFFTCLFFAKNNV
uniref:Protein translocase subunit SecY n=1 Tax=Pyropia pulchra TaxID=60925 RepID=A0A7D5HK43_9RHOD|nr:Protein translocase subunit SecY [Pyropia pulchra]